MKNYAVFSQILAHRPGLDIHLVEDGFSKWALIAPPFWLAWHRLWLGLAVWGFIISFLVWLAAMNLPVVAGILSVLPGLYLGLEGSSMVMAKLQSDGWQQIDISFGRDLEEAEARFFYRQSVKNSEGNESLGHQNARFVQDGVSLTGQTGSKTLKPTGGLFPLEGL